MRIIFAPISSLGKQKWLCFMFEVILYLFNYFSWRAHNGAQCVRCTFLRSHAMVEESLSCCLVVL